MTLRHLSTLTLVATFLLITGCRDREITAYRTPKDQPANAAPSAKAGMPGTGNLPADHPPIGSNLPADHPPIGAGMPGDNTSNSTMANTAVPTAGGDGLQWTAPTGWEPKALGAMRKGSFRLKTATGEGDLSITAFPGATGGLEANLNRWRGQVGLPALAPDQVVADAQTFTANGLTFTVVDYKGPAGRMLGAVVPFGGNSWFFKLTGPDAVITEAKAAYLEFLHTVKAP